MAFVVWDEWRNDRAVVTSQQGERGMTTQLAKIVGSGRWWLRVARLLAAIVILSGLAVASAQAKDDTVKTMPDGSRVECSDSGQYCLCSKGPNSAACKQVKTSCAPGSEFNC